MLIRYQNSRCLGTDLSLRDGSQGLDDRELGIHVRCLVQELHDRLHHPRNSLLELAMFLGKKKNLVVEEVPVTGIFADRDNCND